MTDNNPAQQLLLSEYAKEVLPKFRLLATKKQIVKEWAADDDQINEYKSQIKEMRELIKERVKDVESELSREISDLTTDISLACKAAAKGSEYEAKDLKAYFKMRSEDRVDEVIAKGVTFDALNEEIQ